jgi:CubicO group peptidase (beta-lactamase class C family)
VDVTTASALADEAFDSCTRTATVPSIVYGLVHDGRLVHVRGIQRGTGPIPDADSVFRIASMTKSFTAAAILQLRDAGLLRLDDPIAGHLPWAAEIGTPAGLELSIRDLLTMSGGLPTDDPWGDRQESLPLHDFDALVAGGLSFARPPRTAFEYSNTGYALLGRVIEQVTGTGYRDHVAAELLAPLGMASTGFDPLAVPALRLVPGYRLRADGVAVPEPPTGPGAFSPMGGLLSSVRDLATWLGGFQDAWTGSKAGSKAGHPVAPWSRREQQEVSRLSRSYLDADDGAAPVAVTLGYGFGLYVEERSDVGRTVYHSGGYPGYGSHMRWHPESGWGIVALGNSSYAGVAWPCVSALRSIAGRCRDEAGAADVDLWPATRDAMDVVERLLDCWDDGLADRALAGNADLDVPRGERRSALAAVRAQIGTFERDRGSITAESPARARWRVSGVGGQAWLEILMTPHATPLVQGLTVTVEPAGS